MARPFIIDRQGEESDLDDLAVMADIRDRLSPRKCLEYLARNVGLLVIEPGNRHVTIHLSAKRVTGPALAALYRSLAEIAPERVDLRCFVGSGWSAHVLGLGLLESRLEQLLAESEGKSADRIRRQPISLTSLERGHPFQRLIEAWQEDGDSAGIGFWRPVLEKVGISSFQWTRPDRPSRRLQVVKVGVGMPDCAKRWLAHAKRLSLDDHPDRHYAAYCRETYWRAATEGTPLIESLDLLVDWPTFGLVRRTFHRVLLKVEAPEGALLLGATLFDPTINLRQSPRECDFEVVK
jgi:hypothetical protein